MKSTETYQRLFDEYLELEDEIERLQNQFEVVKAESRFEYETQNVLLEDIQEKKRQQKLLSEKMKELDANIVTFALICAIKDLSEMTVDGAVKITVPKKKKNEHRKSNKDGKTNARKKARRGL